MIIAVGAVGATNPELDWQRAIGTNDANELVYSVLITEDGGYLLAGAKSTTANGLDIYLVRTSPDGMTIWDRTYGGSFDDYAYSIAEGQDGGFVLVGYTRSYGAGGSDVIIMKVDDAGQMEWYRTFGGAFNDVGREVQNTADGGYIIAGTTLSSLSPTSSDAYLIKTDLLGNLIWSSNLGGADFDTANSVQQTSDGGYILAGETGIFQQDALLIKTNSSGLTIWTKTFGGAGSEYAYAVRQTSDGGYILAGTTNSYGSGGDEAYIVKTNSSGGVEWYGYFGGNGQDSARSVVQTSEGNYLLVGSTRSYGAGQNDVFLIEVDQSGDLTSMKTFGGLYDDLGNDITEVGDGSCIIVGETRSFSTTLSQDIYLIKTNAFLDNSPPTLSQLTPAAGAKVAISTPTIGASFSDLSGVDTTSVAVSLDSIDITPGSTISSDGFSYSPQSALAEGDHTIRVEISDVNGNKGVHTWSFRIDTVSPIVSGVSPANRSSINSTRPVINASFSDVGGINTSSVSVRLDLIDITSSTLITETGIQYIPPSAINQGLHTVTVMVRDLTGNAVVTSWVFRVDTTAPTISALSPSNGTNIISFGESRVTISASYSDNAEITVPSIRLLLDGVDITSLATITSTTLSYTGNVGPGSHTVQLTVGDGAGNTSTTTVGFTVTSLVPILIIAIVIIVIIVAILLLLRRRKPKPPLPKWEQPPPPPPPSTTYTPEPEIEAPIAEVKEVPPQPPPPPTTVRVYDSYTKTWFEFNPATGQKTPETKREAPPPPPPEPVPEPAPEPAPEPQPQPPEAVKEPAQPTPPEEATVAVPPPKPGVPEEPKRAVSCPNCGASNSSTAARCWYCERPLP